MGDHGYAVGCCLEKKSKNNSLWNARMAAWLLKLDDFNIVEINDI